MTKRFPTVDADGHLEENHIDWKKRLPDNYKSQAPERRDSGNGHLRTIIEGKAWPRPSGLGVGVGVLDRFPKLSFVDGHFAGASQSIVEHPKLSGSSKRKIPNDNARRLYPLD